MTANAEDYLKVIYQEGGAHKTVPNKVIANKLGIAAPSVTEMLTKLNKQGLIRYTPYKGSLLTEKGLESCVHVVRGHRLWEVFLIRHLGYSWSEAHEDAHLLEHTTPDRMLERLDQFLNYPEFCPHGSTIPRLDGPAANGHDLVPLCALAAGQTGVIRRFTEEKELLDYLEKSGLKIGGQFVVKKIEDYEGPYVLLTEQKEISISYKASFDIYVEKLL